MDRLVILDPPDVTMRFEIGKKTAGMLQLRNVMHTMPVAFTIQTSAPNKYVIKPLYASIAPLGVVNVEIIMNPQAELPSTFPRCEDKFTIKTVVVPGGFKSQETVSVDWFTAKKKAVFCDTGLKVTLVGGGILRDLMRKSRIEEIREVLERDPTVADAANEKGDRAAHLAISMNRPDLLQILLEHKVNLELKNRASQTPLMQAAQAGETLITELLLANGAKTEARNDAGWTALHYATVRGHEDVVKLLIDQGADVDAKMTDGRSPLHIAVSEGYKYCLQLLLDRGCNVDAQGPDGGTVLHIAAARGHVTLVKQLLQRGATREAINFQGRTPYQEAVDLGDGILLDMLHSGDSLRDAARKGDLESVRKFLKEGARIDGEDQYGWTALQRAAFKGRMDVVKYLVQKGANLHHKDFDGYTPLHSAVESCQKDVVQFLLRKGAYIYGKTSVGLTPLELAVNFDYPGIVRMLVQAESLTGVLGTLDKGLSEYLHLEGAKDRHNDTMEANEAANRKIQNTDEFCGTASRSTPLSKSRTVSFAS